MSAVRQTSLSYSWSVIRATVHVGAFYVQVNAKQEIQREMKTHTLCLETLMVYSHT